MLVVIAQSIVHLGQGKLWIIIYNLLGVVTQAGALNDGADTDACALNHGLAPPYTLDSDDVWVFRPDGRAPLGEDFSHHLP